MSGKYRNWCFTSYENLEWAELINERCSYIIVGEEICPHTGKTHWQGYAEFANQITLLRLKKLWGDKIHFEARKGTQEQAIKYCQKDGKYEEYGEKKEQESRTDLMMVRELMDDGLSNQEIIEEATSWQSVNGVERLRQMRIKPRDPNFKPEVFWFWGETGTGKTRKAKEIFNDDYDDVEYVNNFMIGYSGNDNVLLDDFRGGVPFNKLLKMLDYGKCIMNVKNGSVQFSAKKIIITAPFRPEKIYKNIGENIQQLIRRIEHIEHMTEWIGSEVGG